MTAAQDRPTAESREELVDLLEEGGEHLEAPPASFTLLDHSLQCAAVLAAAHPDDIELQVAGLLHDIGHTLLPGEPALHGDVGGSYVRELLGERVAELVRLHVDAKRYLVAVEPEYRARLSMGSAETLIAQGEAMEEAEVEAFRVEPYAEDAVVLRRADEDAKVPGSVVPGLDAWVPLIRRLS